MFVITAGGYLPLAVPFAKMLQLDRQKTSLDRIQPTVITLHVVIVLFGLAMISEHTGILSEALFVSRYRSSLTTCSKILSRIETERGRSPDGTGLPPAVFLLGEILRPMSLASIFNDDKSVFFCDLQDRIHIRHLSVHMYRNNRCYRLTALAVNS